jgi:glycosyltransferase involved in cell wall biosynthesis
LKIAYVACHPDGKSGLERFVCETALGMIKRGHEVKLFCNTMEKNRAYPEMLKIPYEVFSSNRELFNKSFLFRFIANRNLIYKAIKWKPDIILLQQGFILGDYFQQRTKIPIVPYIHYPKTFPDGKSFVRSLYKRAFGIKKLEGIAFKKVPIVLCNSKYTESMIKSLDPTVNTKVIYPAVDHNKFFPSWEDNNFLYYHSRFSESKNQLLAVNAVKKRYHLTLSGYVDERDCEYFATVHREASKYGHTVLTNIDDSEVVSFLQNCSVFLFPSINEPFGMAPIEAMACGKPVIGHNSGATIETVGTVGYLCGDDEAEWRTRIDDLMADGKLRVRMGRNAYEFAKRFTWDKTTEEMIKVFESIS